jgi:DNA integrity scanning protein DisA with diadenylate cyclase activity
VYLCISLPWLKFWILWNLGDREDVWGRRKREQALCRYVDELGQLSGSKMKFQLLEYIPQTDTRKKVLIEDKTNVQRILVRLGERKMLNIFGA